MTAPVKEGKRDWSQFWPKAHEIAKNAGIPRGEYSNFVHEFFKKDSLTDDPRPFDMLLSELRSGVKDFAPRWLEAWESETNIKDMPGAGQTEPKPPPARPPVNGAGQSSTATAGLAARAQIRPKPPIAIKTLMGVDIQDIPVALNLPLPPQAYGEIAFGSMKGKTDLSIEHVRDRLDEVFGPQGLGWAIEPIAGEAQILTSTEVRKSKDGKDQTWYVCDMINYRLRYTVMLPDGSLRDCHGSAMCDSGDNTDRGYALEGAMSSLVKQSYRRMGGMNHLYYGTYTHLHAKRELAWQR